MDARVRDLQRRFLESDSEADRAAWMRARGRGGELQATVVGGPHFTAEIRVARAGVNVIGAGWRDRIIEVITGGDMGSMTPRAGLRQRLDTLAQDGVSCPFLDLYLGWREANPRAKRPEWLDFFRTPGAKAKVAASSTFRKKAGVYDGCGDEGVFFCDHKNPDERRGGECDQQVENEGDLCERHSTTVEEIPLGAIWRRCRATTRSRATWSPRP